MPLGTPWQKRAVSTSSDHPTTLMWLVDPVAGALIDQLASLQTGAMYRFGHSTRLVFLPTESCAYVPWVPLKEPRWMEFLTVSLA